MKRKEKAVTDIKAIEEIISKAKVCRLAMSLDDQPYLVPLNFGYKNKTLYFHCANTGLKLDILKKNPKVCFEMDVSHKLVEGKNPCAYTMTFESVIGNGTARIITDKSKKIDALNILMGQYTKAKDFDYVEKALAKVTIIQVRVDTMTGKSSYL